MGKRKRATGSAPCLEKRSNSIDHDNDSTKIAKGDKIPSQANRIFLDYWYLYGFGAGQHKDN
jgi:hypothetical protein